MLSLAGAVVKLSDLRGPCFGLLPIVWVGILLSVFQQFVGINVIFYYSTTLWRAVGFSEDRALLISVITSVTNILTTLRALHRVRPAGLHLRREGGPRNQGSRTRGDVAVLCPHGAGAVVVGMGLGGPGPRREAVCGVGRSGPAVPRP